MPTLPFTSHRPTRSDDLRATANIGLAITQALAGELQRLSGGGESVADRSRAAQGAVTPTGGAFAIWGPLFLDSLGYAITAARSDRRADPILRQVGWLTAATYAANTLWTLVVQQRGIGWASVGVIGAATTAATTALVLAERAESGTPSARLAANTIAPLAGWVSVATAANVDSALVAAGGARSGPAATRRAVALIAAATGLTGSVAVASRGNPLFGAAAGWGLGGIILKASRERQTPVVVAAAGALATLAAATIAGRRRT